MGTASFGGGSGSIGGGGSGSGGAGGSLLNAIQHLIGISKRLSLDGHQPRLTREILVMLQDRGRAASVKAALTDGFADALLRQLLDVKARLAKGETWTEIAQAYGASTGARALEAFCDACLDKATADFHAAVEEHSLENGSAAFRQFMFGAIGGDLQAAKGDAAAVNAAINKDYFNKVTSNFLGDILSVTIEADSVFPLQSAAAASVEMAADTVAADIFDRFDAKFIKKDKAKLEDIFKTLAANYSSLVLGS